jgi:hypothetical protein
MSSALDSERFHLDWRFDTKRYLAMELLSLPSAGLSDISDASMG